MINAMVSHELKNPLNSIKIQTLREKMLIEKLQDILENLKNTQKISRSQLIRKLTRIHQEQTQINIVQMNCYEILNF